MAIVEFDEVGSGCEVMWGELRAQVGVFVMFFIGYGVGVGDWVVGYLFNGADVVVVFLVIVSIGVIWLVCGMDYVSAVVLGCFG